jgi:hypothetical protein
MIFQPGSDQAFRFERVENEHGAAAGYSLASTANTIFFLANDGFYSFNDNGLNPIGAQRVNTWFRANCDSSRYFAVVVCVVLCALTAIPTNTLGPTASVSEPVCVQVVPSVLPKAVKTFPVRRSRSQIFGNVPFTPLLRIVVSPAVSSRRL